MESAAYASFRGFPASTHLHNAAPIESMTYNGVIDGQSTPISRSQSSQLLRGHGFPSGQSRRILGWGYSCTTLMMSREHVRHLNRQEMLVLVWIVGGVCALGALANSLPPRTWWLAPLAIAWMVGIIPIAIFSMNAGHPFKVAFARALTALRSYLSVMAILVVPAIVVATLLWLVKH